MDVIGWSLSRAQTTSPVTSGRPASGFRYTSMVHGNSGSVSWTHSPELVSWARETSIRPSYRPCIPGLGDISMSLRWVDKRAETPPCSESSGHLPTRTLVT